MSKSLFNFYLDDDLKEKCIAKLKVELGEEMTKGALSSLLRIQLRTFLVQNVSEELKEAIKSEYEYCKNKNKRSKL